MTAGGRAPAGAAPYAGVPRGLPARLVARARGIGPGAWALAALCTVLFVWPVSMIVVAAFHDGLISDPGGTWTAGPLVETLTDPGTLAVLGQSVLLAGVVSVLSMLVAAVFAWMVARTDVPLRGLVTPLMLLTMVSPNLFFAISWDMLGNPRVGLINQVVMAMTGAERGPIDITSWPGLIFVCVLKAVGFNYFLILAPFLAMDRSMEEASLVSGMGKIRTFFRVHVPLLAPALLGALLLAFVSFLEAFDFPQIIGLPAGIRVFSTEIYRYISGDAGGRYAEASSLALVLMVIIVVLIAVQSRVLGRRRYTTMSGKSYRTERWSLGPVRWLGTAMIVLHALLALVLPLIQLYIGSFQSFFGLYDNWTLDNYRRVLDDPDTVSAITTTFGLALVGGFATMLLCVVLAWVVRTRPGLLSRYMAGALWVTVTVPGIVLGMGIMWSFLSVPGLNQLYATVWIMLIGLVIAAVPVAVRTAEGSVAQIPAEFEEAARVSGAGRVRAFLGLILRLLIPSFGYGWLVAAILISGNLAVPLLLASPDVATVAIEVLNLNRSGDTATAAALFGLLLAVWGVLAVLALSARALGRRLKENR
ncbi:iron ABC transporter permease [Microbispora sp. NPDC046933]|uniref:ABC transporter permease n=1 Tax=Microbispora sp. NPDC046933 TaxID=3155618 RepID=UPI0033F94ABC